MKKPIKAWAVLGRRGIIGGANGFNYAIQRNKGAVKSMCAASLGERVVRIEIRIVEEKKK